MLRNVEAQPQQLRLLTTLQIPAKIRWLALTNGRSVVGYVQVALADEALDQSAQPE